MIFERTNLTYEEIKEKIQILSKEKNLINEVAALLFAKDYEVDVAELYKEIEDKIFIS